MSNNLDDHQQEVSRKRKSSSSTDDNNVVLTLSLGIQQVPPPYATTPATTFPSPALASSVFEFTPPVPRTVPGSGPTRVRRRNPTQAQAPRDGTKGQEIQPPYPWATTKRATVHSIDYLDSKHMKIISGQVQCKRCEREYVMELDLHENFLEIGSFLAKNKSVMHDRAPASLMNPVLPTCKFCNQENSVKPLISEKKKTINWLFLLLGQMLGCCTLEQLKYFCKHTKNHRTGAKDRVLYLTYLAICKQLDPNGPFDR